MWDCCFVTCSVVDVVSLCLCHSSTETTEKTYESHSSTQQLFSVFVSVFRHVMFFFYFLTMNE